MKKPDPGWYESPDNTEGEEQYWNGKRWKSDRRTMNEFGEFDYLAVDSQLGRFLFRKPYWSDWAFLLIVSLVALLSIARYYELNTSGGLHTGPGALYTGAGDAVLTIFVYFLFFWIVSLLWLIPRRRIDRRKLAL